MNEEFEHSLGGKLLRVPPGRFIAGSPEGEAGHKNWETQREVEFKDCFYMSQTPLTRRQYLRTGKRLESAFPKLDDEAPLDSLNWQKATEFCAELTSKDQATGVLDAGWEYRLPTEAEWEYCCRAGDLGARYGNLDSVGWYLGNSLNRPQAVAQKSPNAWGFHDMLGNVWEMCLDWFDNQGQRRAARGGSFFNTAAYCRAAAKEGYNGGRYCGFRLVAARAGSARIGPSADSLLPQSSEAPPSTLYSAIISNNVELAEKILADDPAALESYDEIPPPIHWCIYNDRPAMLAWLLDQGADIERQEQDHGASPLRCAVVMRHPESIRLLLRRGANSVGISDVARRGAAGEFESFGLDREGYLPIQNLLDELLGT